MTDVIILGDPDFGRIYYHEEAASRVENKEAVAIRSAAELAKMLEKGDVPKLLVIDFGWANVAPSVLYKALDRDQLKSITSLVIKNHNGSSSENQLKNYLNVAGFISISAQTTSALPNIINKFFEISEGTNADRKLKKFQSVINKIISETNQNDTDYIMAAADREPKIERAISDSKHIPS